MTLNELIQRAVFDHIIVQGRENDLKKLLKELFPMDNTYPAPPEEGENHAD